MKELMRILEVDKLVKWSYSKDEKIALMKFALMLIGAIVFGSLLS